MDWYQLPIEELQDLLNVSLSNGLGEEEALRRLEHYGKNRVRSSKEKTVLQVLLAQFLSPVTYLLIVAALISFALGDRAEGIAILIVVIINAVIGFYMEWQALTSMKALKKMDVLEAKVIREGILKQVSSEDITIGDLICMDPGDLIPADARIIESKQLQTDESALTGESLPVSKNAEAVEGTVIVAEQKNLLFKGTLVVTGKAKALVVKTGMDTELGKLSDLVQHAEQSATPLERKLEALTEKLIWLTLFIAILFFSIGWIKGYGVLQMLETAIAMAVAAIPEGLPIVATIALAYGMLKMARRNVLVKHLAAVETLGSTTIILTDKTGTLTQNKISTAVGITADHFYDGPAEWEKAPALQQLLLIAVLCNDASIYSLKEIGDPLEVALIRWAKKNKYPTEKTRSSYKRIDEEAFSSETQFMATLHEHDGQFYTCVKGAVEEVLKKCKWYINQEGIRELDNPSLKYWQRTATELAEKGIRVLAFAFRVLDTPANFHSLEQLVFTGLIGFSDPPYEQVAAALDQCREAGIKVVMLTGDHPATALHVARQIHLIQNNEAVINGKDMQEWERWNEKTIADYLKAAVFARVTPKQKLDIVQFYQENGYVTAMTGDGVNDAPALKKADIGIAMGKRGTQIAKETADLILKDDSFMSIVAAVKQGRIIFENIRKCIVFLISCNLSEILVISVAIFLFLSSPLSPLQILYLNLVTDVFPALALALSRGEANCMKRSPRNSKEGILAVHDWQAILTYSVIITFSICSAFIFCSDYLHLDRIVCNNVVFISLALAQLWHVFNLPSADQSFFKNEITANRYVWGALLICILIMVTSYLLIPIRNVLSVKALNAQLLLIILVASLLPLLFIQLLKRLRMIV